MSVSERVRELVADALGLEVGEIDENANMESVELWDSLQHLGVVTAIEAELEVTLSPEEVTSLSSVAAIIALFEERG